MDRRVRGVTLPELLVVIAIISIVMLAIVTTCIQAGKVWARTTVRIEPQRSVMLAFQRMDTDIREAMLIDVITPSPSTWITVYKPDKEANGMDHVEPGGAEAFTDVPVLINNIEVSNHTWDPAEPFTDLNDNGVRDSGEPYDDVNGDSLYSLAESYTDENNNGRYDSEDPRFQLIKGKAINYFLGRKLSQHGQTRRWTAKPDALNGDTLFRAEGTPVGGVFLDAQILVEGIVNPTKIRNPELVGPEVVKKTLFTYQPYDDNGTPSDFTDDMPTSNTQLITITLIVQGTDQAGKPIYQPLWTEFCLRNLRS